MPETACPSDHGLVARVRQAIAQRRLFADGQRVLAALSGGLDSTCLLHLLATLRPELRLELVAATLDHGLRPFSRELELTAAQCRGLQVEHVPGALEPGLPERAAAAGLSLEHQARNERHAWLQSVAARAGCSRIALGHHADDQAETVLMRLLRGTGLAGVAGMRPLVAAPPFGSRPLVRPLLEITRAELAAYAAANSLAWSEDPTNASDRHVRNRIRKHVMPELGSLNPKASAVISRSALVMGDESEALEMLVEQALERITEAPAAASSRHSTAASPPPFDSAQGRRGEANVRLAVSIADLGLPPLRNLLLHRLLARVCPAPPAAELVEKVSGLCDCHEGTAEWSLPGGGEAWREYGTLLLFRRNGEEDRAADGGAGLGPSLTVGARIEAVEVCGEGEFDCWAGTLRVRRVVCGPIPADESPVALFDARQLRFPLLVRQWKEGDRILPFGGTGRKKLSDLFIDRKIPRAARRQVPVVTDCQEAVLWVVGVQRSAHWPALPGEPAFELTFDSPAGLATMPRS